MIDNEMPPDTARTAGDTLRVLFVLTALRKNGAVLNVLETVRRLDRSRFEPVLFLSRRRPRDPFWRPFLAGVPTVVGSDGRDGRCGFLQLPSRLLGAAKEADVVVGSQELASTYLAVLAAKLTGKPSVGWVHNSLPDHFYQTPSVHRRLVKSFYPHLTVAVGVSEGVKESLAKFVPPLNQRIRTIYNLLEVDEVQKAALEPSPATLPEGPFILAVGRLEHQKGFDLLVQAYAMLKAWGLEHKLVILGSGPRRPQLQALVEEMKLSQSVLMPGFQENPYPWMRRASVFVLSSRYEGFGRVVTEAMAVGTPMIATDCPSGPAEVLQGDRSGVLVPPDDPTALAEAVRSLLRDEGRLAELRAVGRARANDFKVATHAQAFGSVISEAVVLHASRARTDLYVSP